MKIDQSEYYQRYNEIKTTPGYLFGLAQAFVSEILALPPEDRFSLLPLLKQIEEDAFQNGFVISNLNYELIEKDKQIWEITKSATPVKSKETKAETEDDFNKVLIHFFSKYESFFLRIKGFFAFRLDNSPDAKTKVIVLYDENYNKHPEIDLFNVSDEQLDIKKYPLHDFLDLAKKTPEIVNQNYLCVLLVASNLRNNEVVIPDINNLLEAFSSSSFISIRKIPVIGATDYEIKDASEGIESLKSYSDKVFNNRALSFEEELIIKKLFDGSEMILDYKFLKGGNSGSKVIEIQPLRGNHPEMGRFVVKFEAKNSERKLKKEKALFRQYVADLLVPSYTAEYDDTITHEAIRYNYASSDSKKESFPFSKLINDHIRGKYGYSFSLKTVIEELFSCDPYKIWDTKTPEVTEPVKNLYADYLKSEGKVFKTIAMIQGISEEEVKNTDLVKNYKIIKDYSLKTNQKICHGDLHSENFFKDDKGVYLIDFGWTKKHHALIDYTTLECSLKFKHLPFYIPVTELLQYENGLLSIDSFSSSFDLSFIKRQTAFDVFKLITQIREIGKAHMADNANSMEYLISLFIISFRQIQYSDLNQNYAMNSAEILSRKIIELIK